MSSPVIVQKGYTAVVTVTETESGQTREFTLPSYGMTMDDLWYKLEQAQALFAPEPPPTPASC